MTFTPFSTPYIGSSNGIPVPKYYHLKETIVERIANGTWTAGLAIPPEPELCREFGVSRITVRRAISDLVHEGKLYTIQGKGTFVARPKLDERFVHRAFGFFEDMERQGLPLTTQILQQEVIPAPDIVATHLEISPATPVHVLVRLRFVQDEKVLVSTTYIPKALCPDLVHDDLTTGSLYQWLQTRYGLTVARAERNLEAVAAQQREAELLDIALYSPLLLLESVVYLPNGKPLEYSSIFHRGDRIRVSISFVSTTENQMTMSAHDGGASQHTLMPEQ
jgi:GntR family transcriptional regulator